jgi:Protein of unknown function (DUF995)
VGYPYLTPNQPVIAFNSDFKTSIHQTQRLEKKVTNRFASTICILLFPVALSAPALADKLPKTAVPLTSAEVTALYSGHTVVWQPSIMVYFAADGSAKQLIQGISKPGTWSVKDNEFCMAIQGVDAKTKKLDGKTYTDCWQWLKDKKKYYTLYSKHWDDAKVDMTNYNTKDIKTLKAGDLIGAKFVAPQN